MLEEKTISVIETASQLLIDPIFICLDNASITIVPANKTKNPQTKKRNNLKRFNRQSTNTYSNFSFNRFALIFSFFTPKSVVKKFDEKKILGEIAVSVGGNDFG